MLSYSRKFVNTVELVVQLEQIENMHRLQFDFEDRLKPLLQVESRSLDNVPPPPGVSRNRLPRWVMAKGDKLLIATDTSIALTLNFHGTAPQAGVLSVVERHAKLVDDAIQRLIPPEKVQFVGCVFAVNFTYSGSAQHVETDIAQMLLKSPAQGDVVLANAALGYRGRPGFSNLNFHYGAQGYRTVDITMPTDSAAGLVPFTEEDVGSAKAREWGLAIRIDVNSRATGSVGADGARSLVSLMPACKDALTSGLREFLQDQSVEVDGL
jgi:hypothetical protein